MMFLFIIVIKIRKFHTDRTDRTDIKQSIIFPIHKQDVVIDNLPYFNENVNVDVNYFYLLLIEAIRPVNCFWMEIRCDINKLYCSSFIYFKFFEINN